MNENKLAPRKLFDDIVYVVETAQNYWVLDNPGLHYSHQLSPNETIGLAKFMNCVAISCNSPVLFDWPALIYNLDIWRLFKKYPDITGMFDAGRVVIVRLGFTDDEPIV